MGQARLLRILEATSVLLFFLQALRVIFSVLFGIIYDQVFAGTPNAWLVISVLLVLLALLAPAAAPAAWSRRWLAWMAILATLARVALSVNDATIRYWSSLIVLAAGGLYLTGMLIARRPMVLPTIVGAILVDQGLRAAGQTYDLSLQPGWLPVQAVWAAGVVVLSLVLTRQPVGGDQHPSRLSAWAGLGLGGALFLETSLLALPNAVARWSATAYPVHVLALMVVTLLPLFPHARFAFNRLVTEWPVARAGLAVLLPGLLMAAYFVPGLPSATALVLAQALALGVLACLIDGRAKRQRSTGGMLALGLSFLLLLNFLNAFAFTYPYSLPAMRGLGWAVYLAAGLAAAAGVAAQTPQPVPWKDLDNRMPVEWFTAVVSLGVAIVFTWPQPASPLPESGRIRLATYNIHYGYDVDWHFNLDQMAEAIEAEAVDVIALQEVDTGRLTSYAVDDALYLARRLRMNVAYLPTVEHLTGIAVLYPGQAFEVERQLLTSLQEQTGIIRVALHLPDQTLSAHGIWMGLSDEDTSRQIREALDFIGGRTPASFGGDFNAEPGSPVVETVLEAGFEDPFQLLGIEPAPPTDPAIDPVERIDYVWLRGLRPTRAWVAESLASDHRMVVVEVELAP
ncbi:MAG: endonuclease/exonuclease/phosphatase family protein [Chloroflexota bacterium]